MTYTVTDALKINDKVYLALDRARTARDLLCNSIVINNEIIKVNWIHPNELIQIEYKGNQDNLIGKNCSFTKR